MAALDFPSSPSLNQVYTANGYSWKWNGVSWISLPTITGGSINGTTIGATTPSTGAFTTLSASGQLTVTGSAQNAFGSSFTPVAWGVSSVDINHASGGLLALYYGGSPKGYLIALSGGGIGVNTQGAGTLDFNINGTQRAQISSTGLSVTGALSASCVIAAQAGAVLVGSGGYQMLLRTISGTNRLDSYNNPITATAPLQLNASQMTFQIADSTKMSLTSTGLAVTGAITATENVGLAAGKLLTLNGNNTAASYAIQAATAASPYDFRFIGSYDSTTQRNFSFGYYTSDSASNTWNPKVTINSYAGKVGIGTTSPDYPLDVRSYFNSGGWNYNLKLTDGTYATFLIGHQSGSTILQSDASIKIAPSNTIIGNFTSSGLAVTGNLSCTGALSKGSGSFRIDHPLPEKKNTHHLVHSFIEGPKADLIYRGKVDLVNGKAFVNIDAAATMTEGTFKVLCRNVQCFTTNESGWTAVRGQMNGNILVIEAQDATCTDSVSWLVIGERQDPHMMDTDWTDDNGRVIVEPLKAALEGASHA